MSHPFHYVVKSKLIRSSESNTQNLIEFEKVFEHDNPIIARRQAFNHYQNYIDVLLEGKGKKYISDIQARRDLFTHIDSGTAQTFSNNKITLDFNDDYDKGIGIYLINDKSVKYKDIDLIAGEKYLIHSIEHFDKRDLIAMIEGLICEKCLYKYYGYNFKGYNSIVDFCKFEFSQFGSRSILKTPFDWFNCKEVMGMK